MADKIEGSSPAAGSQEEIAEKRREKRYDVPDAYRQYIKLRVKSGNEFVPAILGNFSRSGILFECPAAFSQGKHTECIISISLLLSREIAFGIEVKYCYADHGSYIMGASIDTISDETWFDVFVEVHDFIVLRKNSG
jgi:hypothetical protein